MLSPYEVAAKSAIPAFRALIAKILVTQYGFTQEKAARSLGITQAAISNYMRGVRGSLISFEDEYEVGYRAEVIATMLLEGRSQNEVMSKFAQACEAMRQKRLMCGAHKQLEPEIDVDACHLCNGPIPAIDL